MWPRLYTRDVGGRLERIWIKRVGRGPMDTVPAASLEAGRGLAGNANRGGRRQVTLLSAERWREVEGELGRTVEPALRRANLLVSGVELTARRGEILAVGRCRLRIWGETRPCERMESAAAGLRAALATGERGGIYGEVVSGGAIAVGDPVAWEAGSADP